MGLDWDQAISTLLDQGQARPLSHAWIRDGLLPHGQIRVGQAIAVYLDFGRARPGLPPAAGSPPNAPTLGPLAKFGLQRDLAPPIQSTEQNSSKMLNQKTRS